jgi:hypothetical protein
MERCHYNSIFELLCGLFGKDGNIFAWESRFLFEADKIVRILNLQSIEFPCPWLQPLRGLGRRNCLGGWTISGISVYRGITCSWMLFLISFTSLTYFLV